MTYIDTEDDLTVSTPLILAPGMGEALIARNRLGFNLTVGGEPKFSVPAGSALVRVDEFGNLIAGLNALVSSGNPGTFKREVPDFMYAQNAMRLFTRSLTLSMLEDPADINGRRFGPIGGAPYAQPNNQIGDNMDLTGIAAGTIFQIRSTPAVIPYGGDVSTPGARADQSNVILAFRCAEDPRDLTGLEDYALGSQWRVSTIRKGRGTLDDILQVSSTGGVMVGRAGLEEGERPETLYVRGEAGRNEKQRITMTGTVTGGTFTLTHYGPGLEPPGQETAAIPWDATAATVKAKLEALTSIGADQLTVTGGPLPANPVDVEFTGATVESRNFTRLGRTSSLTGGGAVAVATLQDGIPSGAGTKLIVLRHGGKPGETPTAPYLELQDPAGNPVFQFQENGTPRFFRDMRLSDTTGTRIGTDPSQKLAFFGRQPVTQRAFIPSPAADLSALKSAVDAIRQTLIELGATAAS